MTPQSEDCSSFLESFGSSPERGLVPVTVVLELVLTFERQYNIDRMHIADAILELTQFTGIVVENADAFVSALIEYRQRRSVSFADSYHSQLALQRCDGMIASYDRALSRIPGITRIEPGTALP